MKNRFLVLIMIFLASTIMGNTAEWGFFLIPKVGDPLEDLRSVSWSRLTGLVWPRLQNPNGTYNWSFTDEEVKKAQERGYNLVFVIKTGNSPLISEPSCFAAVERASDYEKALHSCPLKPKYKDAWKALIKNTIERYDGDGKNDMPGLAMSFVMELQIENEAGNSYYWDLGEKDGKKAATEYLKVLKLAHEARMEANPGTRIILPGLFDLHKLARCSAGNAPAALDCKSNYVVRNRDFTVEILKHPQYFDAIDAHFFNYFKFDPYYIQESMAWLRSEMKKNGYAKPIYSLEWTGSFMMNIKPEGQAKAFSGHFPYTAELGNEAAFAEMYKTLSAPEHEKYRAWFEGEQARELPKLFATMLANGVEKMVYVRFSDYTNTGWDNLWWNWQGIVRYEGTAASPRLIKKPSYYTYQLLERQLSGFQSVETMNLGDKAFAYKFSFKEKPAVLVAWTEGPATTIDLSRSGVSGNVAVTHVITELDQTNNPVRIPVTHAPVSAVPVTSAPILVTTD